MEDTDYTFSHFPLSLLLSFVPTYIFAKQQVKLLLCVYVSAANSRAVSKVPPQHLCFND